MHRESSYDSSQGWCFIWNKKDNSADFRGLLPLYFIGSYSLRLSSKGWSQTDPPVQATGAGSLLQDHWDTKSQHRTFHLKWAADYLKLFVGVAVLWKWDKAIFIMEIRCCPDKHCRTRKKNTGEPIDLKVAIILLSESQVILSVPLCFKRDNANMFCFLFTLHCCLCCFSFFFFKSCCK